MSIRLHEVGPRLELKLYKIEEGFMQGNVVYNRVGINLYNNFSIKNK